VDRPLPSRLAGAGLVIAIAMLLAACSSSAATPTLTAAPPSAAPATSSAAPSSAGTAGTAVSIKDFSFEPADLTAKVGQEITWTNTGNAAHTVSFNTGNVDSGSMSSGATFKHTFDTPGTYTYHCNFHSNMEATITITP
jgi:plastocyanin